MALTPGQVITITYRIANASIVDGGPNDGQLVSGVLVAGKKIEAVLAQTSIEAGAPELPGILAFVPVCPVGSTGGAKAAGEECDPVLAECGTGVCGCESALAGVTCTDGIAANRISLNVTQAIPMDPGQMRTIATVRVRRLAGSAPTVNCGEFFTHMHSAEDLLDVTDPICESVISAGAQASSDLHAPECFAATDCGDVQCNACADIDTNNHCEPANIGGSCGTDGNVTDCLTPACVVGGAGDGECLQDQNPVGAGTVCTNNGGAPVSAVECQTPECDDGGTCTNVADPSQNGNACGADADLQDCLTPACLDGGCAQEQNPVGAGVSCTNNGGTSVPAVECQVPLCDAGGICTNVPDPSQDGSVCTDLDANDCHRARCAAGGCDQSAVCDPTENPAVCKVTISDTIFADDDADGIQDAGEAGFAGVDVAVLTCSAGVPSILQGSDTTDAAGHYSFDVATCNPSETLAIDVSGNFSGVLAGYTESPAFCDAGNPGNCGAEVSPAVDSNCINGVSDCRSILLSTEDPTVDCGFSLCGNGVINPGEECDEPGKEICNNSIDDDGDNIIDCDDPDCGPAGFQGCGDDCQLTPPCQPILRDPATLSWERFKMHGYFVPTTSADPMVDGFVILITNEDGEVFRGRLYAGDLKQVRSGEDRKLWSFKDAGARVGEGTRGGISRVWVKQRRQRSGELQYPFRIEVYGDMSRATKAEMTTQVYLNDDVGSLSATWLGAPGRWYLTQKQQAGAGIGNE